MASTGNRDTELRSQPYYSTSSPNEKSGLRDTDASSTKQTPTPVPVKPTTKSVAVAEKPENGLRDADASSTKQTPTPAKFPVKPPIKPRLSNAQLLDKAKQDATNAAIQYKKNNPEVVADKEQPKPVANEKSEDNSMTSGEMARKASYNSDNGSSMTPTEQSRKFDYASAAGTALNTAKKVGGSIVDKVKEEAPDLLNRGAKVLASLSGGSIA